MKVIVNKSNQEIENIDVLDSVFSVPLNLPLVHQVINSYVARGHIGTKKQKTRAEVSGGNTKPWPQKGTGRARASSTRNPIFRTGGVTFASRALLRKAPKVNRKMYQLALRNILSNVLRQGNLSFIDQIVVESHKTRDFPFDNGLFVVSQEEINTNLVLAARNLPHVLLVTRIDPYLLLKHKQIYITLAALRNIEAHLA